MTNDDATLRMELQLPGSDEWLTVGYMHNANQRNWFDFDNSYWSIAHRPILGQVFEERGPRWEPSARVALPHWFSHLLPEGRLRRAVSDTADVSNKREFDLLAWLGPDDLPGALRALPVEVRRPKRVPAVETDNEESYGDPVLKFSLAGVQMKFSVYGDEKGLVVPARGTAGNVILKFPDPRPGHVGVPEAELGSLKLASAIGLSTPEAFLYEPADVVGLEEWAALAEGRALAVHRFDRTSDNRRVHMEELAQIQNIPANRDQAKYDYANNEIIASVISGLAGVEAVAEVIDRIVLNVAIGNGDAHLKNWAVLYPDGIHPTLSPVYDISPTALYMPNEDLGLNLGETKDFNEIAPSHFRDLGERSEYGGREAEKRALFAWERIGENLRIMRDYLTTEHYDRLRFRFDSLFLEKRPH